MRLTLRTLLAYLDGNLEPDDAEDIGKKIQESEFATQLVHRIRDCTRRTRLGTPSLIGRGLGADPNTVAEYLEYRLGDDRVPEFERICLESEAHLAEVASCHQILTLVLGEPAEVDPQMRQHLYSLVAHADAPPVQNDIERQPIGAAPAVTAAAASTPTLGVSPPAVTRRPKPEVPDYLRESGWRLWPVAALVLVAATLTFAGLVFFGPALFRDRFIALTGGAPEEAQAKTPTEPEKTTDQQPPETATAPPATAEKSASAPEVAPDMPPVGSGDEAQPLEPAGDAAPALPEPAVMPPDASSEAATPIPPEPAPLVPDKSDAADAGNATTAAPQPLPGELPATEGGTPAEPMPGVDAPQPLPGVGAGAPAAPREPAQGFGRYIKTTHEVLLKLDPATGDWTRLPADSPLNKGDRLLSLPLSCPMITLSSNISMQADGSGPDGARRLD